MNRRIINDKNYADIMCLYRQMGEQKKQIEALEKHITFLEERIEKMEKIKNEPLPTDSLNENSIIKDFNGLVCISPLSDYTLA